MYSYIEQVRERITDPNKLKKLARLPEHILGLIVESGLTESDFDELRKFDIAYKARGLYRMKAIDYGSPQYKEWEDKEKRFISNKSYISYSQLFKKQGANYKHSDVLSMSKIEIISAHPHRLGDLGIELIGAVPKRQNQVEVLIKHNQIRWLPPMQGDWREEMMPLDSEDYNIPKQVAIGELKWDDGFYFTMAPLDKRSNYYDVLIPR